MKKRFILVVAVMAALLLTSCTSTQRAAEASRSENEGGQLQTPKFEAIVNVKFVDHGEEEFSLEDYISPDDPGVNKDDRIKTAEDAIAYANLNVSDSYIPIYVHHFGNSVWLVEYAYEGTFDDYNANTENPIGDCFVALGQEDARVIASWQYE